MKNCFEMETTLVVIKAVMNLSPIYRDLAIGNVQLQKDSENAKTWVNEGWFEDAVNGKMYIRESQFSVNGIEMASAHSDGELCYLAVVEVA